MFCKLHTHAHMIKRLRIMSGRERKYQVKKKVITPLGRRPQSLVLLFKPFQSLGFVVV